MIFQMIRCKPGESVFEAVERGIEAGIFPSNSRVYLETIDFRNPKCENQVGSVRVNGHESYAVMRHFGQLMV